MNDLDDKGDTDNVGVNSSDDDDLDVDVDDIDYDNVGPCKQHLWKHSRLDELFHLMQIIIVEISASALSCHHHDHSYINTMSSTS